MTDFFYRTEEIRVDEIGQYFVETKQDRQVIDQLKGVNPVVLVGSRGVGKSFLFRIAQSELISEFNTKKVLPVYITFRSSSLIHTVIQDQFLYWMMSRICHETLRALSKSGLLSFASPSISVLAGEPIHIANVQKTKIEYIAEAFEESWKTPGREIDIAGLPTVDDFLDAIEDICSGLNLRRIVLLVDEAAHIFLPEQQRQFFTLFRDLRSPYLTYNAAVYPGVTSYGDTFQPIHDATILTLNRDIQDLQYVNYMSEIVIRQSNDSTFIKNIARRGENFAILAYASSGNPRHLLKTLAKAQKLDSDSINSVIREYYRTEIWSEHTALAEKYPGHRALVDWGRLFIESVVLPELHQKNRKYLLENKKTSCFFWMHRDIPQPVKEALRLLQYTGIVTEHSSGIKATRSEIGSRYSINLGSLMSHEATPTVNAFKIAKSITIRRMTEYGWNYSSFDSLLKQVPNFVEPNISMILTRQLTKDINALDLTQWQIEKLTELGINTIGDILRVSETRLQEAYYVGEKRARRIRNTAMAAVYEYLSG